MRTHDKAIELAKLVKNDRNEATTRHQIIDVLLHDILGCPRSAVVCEQHINAGYLDYALRDKAGKALLVIEAKKEGKSFILPKNLKTKSSKLHKTRLRTLATVSDIKKAIFQVTQYCPQIGAQFACITNGHAYIIFRSIVPGREILDADALVIPSLDYFSGSFVQAEAIFSYESLTENRSLSQHLNTTSSFAREFYYPKNGINHYDAPIPKNNYAKFLEPLAKKYFGDISVDDKRLMESCYVYAPGAMETEGGIRGEVLDTITPFFEADGGAHIESTRTGGALSHRIAQSLKRGNSEVLILYGGKGAGKSTFLRRLLYYDPPVELQLHLFPIIVDFLKAPQNAGTVDNHTWLYIIETLDIDQVLSGSIEGLARLFSDRMEIAELQELSVYDGKDDRDYKIKRGELLAEWKKDTVYVVKCLQTYWKDRGKGLMVVFDNTDQLAPKLQDHCFLLAQHIAQQLACITLISMREERYCRARTMGVLDAYHNTGFHLAAPDLMQVFQKRLKLTIKEIKRDRLTISGIHLDEPTAANITLFLVVCLRQFKHYNNSLTKFLRECSRANIRLALDFFKQFLVSGYTNVDEMIAIPGWTVSDHQVIKPMMIPERHNYDEAKSIIPNIFQCRNSENGSHFTGMRLLQMLNKGSVNLDGAYARVDVLCANYEDRFGMKKDFEKSLDVFLRHGLIESNNRLDAYEVESSKDQGETIYADEIKITAFGSYVLEFLCCTFAYIDLVSLDCGLVIESLYGEFCKSAGEERSHGVRKERRELLNKRIVRANKFAQYLMSEESREEEEYFITVDETIVGKWNEKFQKDLVRVERSAKKNIKNECCDGMVSLKEAFDHSDERKNGRDS